MRVCRRILPSRTHTVSEHTHTHTRNRIGIGSTISFHNRPFISHSLAFFLFSFWISFSFSYIYYIISTFQYFFLLKKRDFFFRCCHSFIFFILSYFFSTSEFISIWYHFHLLFFFFSHLFNKCLSHWFVIFYTENTPPKWDTIDFDAYYLLLLLRLRLRRLLLLLLLLYELQLFNAINVHRSMFVVMMSTDIGIPKLYTKRNRRERKKIKIIISKYNEPMAF